MPQALTLLAALVGCTDRGTPPPDPAPTLPQVTVDKGVDLATRTIRIGALNDETGPASALGRPFALGKRLVAARIAAGGSGLLPEGWTVTLVERDHGYDPEAAVRAYEEIHDQILFVGTSFGTPNTLPLHPMLERDQMMAFPGSLSSSVAAHPNTPPLAAPYTAEARRGMDFAVDRSDGTPIRPAIVYQRDDYGTDGRRGWEAAAKAYQLTIVSDQAVDPGQTDTTTVVAALAEAGATHVMLTVLASTTTAILEAASALDYAPVWIGATPAWSDRFFDDPASAPRFATYHQANALPYWGEDLPGMDDFLAIYATHGAAHAPPNGYILMSYVQGLVQIEAANRAIAAGDLTRAGYRRALHTMKSFDGEGMVRPVDLSTRPYRVSDEVRILTPDFEASRWTVEMDYGHPGARPKTRPGQDAMDDDANALYPPGEGGDR